MTVQYLTKYGTNGLLSEVGDIEKPADRLHIGSFHKGELIATKRQQI